MKLSDHVDHIRELTYKAFDKQFARLGIGKSKTMEIEKIPEELHGKRQKLDALLQSHIDEVGSYEEAREKALDELTFTLFNRIAAIKVMEANSLFPPIITKQSEHGDRSFGHKAWLEEHPEMRSEDLEGIREYIKHAFNELGNDIPLYHKDYPYALLPYVIELNEIIDAFNAVEDDAQVEENIWQSDDILGWLYESYNNAKKQAFKDSKAKTEYDKVSLQSQVYTPRWVVQFLVENSLGKLYLEMYPDSEIKENHKIANAPTERVRERKPLHEVKLIDPASGSGNFLLYAFDLFYELYIDQIENYGADYDEDDIPKLIIENNLHGIDLDDRAIQLAQLGLFIKAKRKRRNIGNLNFNVISSDFYLPEYEEVSYIFEDDNKLDSQQEQLIENIWGDLKFAYKFGSLIKIEEKIKVQVEALYDKVQREGIDLFSSADIEEYKDFEQEFFANLEKAVFKYAKKEGNSFMVCKTQDAITFLKLLTTKYDIATANPPYIDSRDYGHDLRAFLDKNYRSPENYYKNLYAVFVKRVSELVNKNGKFACIHPRTFMFISSFEDTRNLLLNRYHINIFVDFGLSNLFGDVMVDPCFYVVEAKESQELSTFIGLDEYTRTPLEKRKKEFTLTALEDSIDSKINKHLFRINQNDFQAIETNPFIFWLSDSLRDKFKLDSLEQYFDICNGISSGGNNERFYRYWWEIENKDILNENNEDSYKWVLINKGGEFNKWYGNLWLVFEWEKNGKQLKELKKTYPSIRYSSEQYYFKEGLAFSGSSTKGLSVRYQPPNCIFERSGKSIFQKNIDADIWYLMCILNSKLSSYIINSLNPTVSFQSGDIDRIPYVIPSFDDLSYLRSLAQKNKDIKEYLSQYKLVEPKYKNSILRVFPNNSLIKSIKNYLSFENYLHTQILLNEALINHKIFNLYELNDTDKLMVLTTEGVNIGELPVEKEAKKAYLLNEVSEFPIDNLRDYIKALPETEHENKEAIISEFGSLYQSNNDLEEFCIRHQVNPINVLYWFKETKVIPKQRMNKIAMEFLADMIREILMEDEDGIVPLVHNASEKVLIDRIQDKFHEKGFSSAQFSSFDSLIGRELNDYLNNHFFKELSDHLNLFMYMPRTPFIWHLTSGEHQGFDVYIIIYKWSRDNLFRLKSVYIEHRERSLVNRQSDLANDNSAKAQNEKDLIYKQLQEIKEFKLKIDELLEEGYDPVLDSGVGKNIAPLQKKKMLAYDVLNAGQLKKYLAADW